MCFDGVDYIHVSMRQTLWSFLVSNCHNRRECLNYIYRPIFRSLSKQSFIPLGSAKMYKHVGFFPQKQMEKKIKSLYFFMKEIFRHMERFSFDIIEMLHFRDSETLNFFFIVLTAKWFKIFQLLKWNTNWCIFLPV